MPSDAVAPHQGSTSAAPLSANIGLRAYGASDHGETWDPAERGGTALMAAGAEEAGRPLVAWRIGFAGDETAASWSDFLAELPGEPSWVLTDGSEALRMAVRKRWPKTNLYACEFHLGQAVRKAATADGIWPDDPLHASRFERVFWSEADWNALVELVIVTRNGSRMPTSSTSAARRTVTWRSGTDLTSASAPVWLGWRLRWYLQPC